MAGVTTNQGLSAASDATAHTSPLVPTAAADNPKSRTEVSGGKAVTQGTTLAGNATLTNGSPSVTAQGDGLARNTDSTVHKQPPSTGALVEGGGAGAKPNVDTEAKKACSMVKIKVLKSGKRTLEDSKILEIVDDDVTELEAERINAKKQGPPECPEAKPHTKWIISRKKGGDMNEKKEELFGDKQTLAVNWYNPNPDFAREPPKDVKLTDKEKAEKEAYQADKAAKNLKDAQNAADREAGERIAKDSRVRRGLDPNTIDSNVQNRTPLTGDRAAAKAEAREAWKNGGRDAVVDEKLKQKAKWGELMKKGKPLITAATNIKSIYDWLKVFRFRNDPRRINIQAIACSGSQSFELVIFPYKEAEFDLKDFGPVKAAFEKLKSFAEAGQRLLNTIGARFRLDIKLLEDPAAKFVCQWKELDRDVPSIGLKKYQCNKAVYLDLSCTELLSAEVKLGVPLSALLNAIPGLGWVAQKIIDYVADAQVGVRFKVQLGIKLSFGWNEYEEILIADLTVPLAFEFFLYASISIRRLGSVTVEGGAQWKPTFGNLKKYPPENDIGFDLQKGSIDPGVKAMFQIRALWWERDESGSWFPDSWKYKYGDQTFRPLRSLFAKNDG